VLCPVTGSLPQKFASESGPTCEKYPANFPLLTTITSAGRMAHSCCHSKSLTTDRSASNSHATFTEPVTCCHAIRFTTAVSLLVRSHRSKNTSVHYIPEQIRQPLNYATATRVPIYVQQVIYLVLFITNCYVTVERCTELTLQSFPILQSTANS